MSLSIDDQSDPPSSSICSVCSTVVSPTFGAGSSGPEKSSSSSATPPLSRSKGTALSAARSLQTVDAARPGNATHGSVPPCLRRIEPAGSGDAEEDEVARKKTEHRAAAAWRGIILHVVPRRQSETRRGRSTFAPAETQDASAGEASRVPPSEWPAILLGGPTQASASHGTLTAAELLGAFRGARAGEGSRRPPHPAMKATLQNFRTLDLSGVNQKSTPRQNPRFSLKLTRQSRRIDSWNCLRSGSAWSGGSRNF